MEEEISSLYKVIDEANLTKADLEAQMESMAAELNDLERNHEEVCTEKYCNFRFGVCQC